MRLEDRRGVSRCPSERAVQSGRLGERSLLVNAAVGDDAGHRDNSHWMHKRLCTVQDVINWIVSTEGNSKGKVLQCLFPNKKVNIRQDDAADAEGNSCDGGRFANLVAMCHST